MRILLDTNALIWALGNSKRLGRRARRLLENPSNLLFVSTVSLAECAIKARANKLQGVEKLSERVVEQDFTILDFDTAAADTMSALPELSWRDPFDTMLLAHAASRGLHFATADQNILALGWPGLKMIDTQA